MNKLILIPIFFLTMCAPAPVTDPPAHAMEIEEELMWKAHVDLPNRLYGEE